MTSTRPAAHVYSRLGWIPIALHFPTRKGCSCELRSECSSPGKHPIRRWPAEYRPDSRAIDTIWRRNPDANVGIITGAVSGLLVLDVDTKHGGMDSLEELRRRYRLAETLTAESGSGGLHLYYRHPAVHIGPSAGKLGPGLDIRADRGLIVAPPSLHANGMRYRWLNWGAALDATPAWLVQALTPPPPKKRRVELSGDHSAYVKAALDSAAELVRNAPEGTRHDVLWRQAFALGTLVGAGILSRDEARNVLFNAIAGHAGIRSLRAAEKTIDASLDRGARCPRQVAS